MNITVLVIILAIIALITSCFIGYCYLKQNTIDEIRGDVYQLFLKAEKIYKHGENSKKFKFVVQQARGLLPSWASLFISDYFLDITIEAWFRMTKDLLDDGKMNKSSGGK